MLEKNFYPLIKHYLEREKPNTCLAIEVKLTKEKSIPYDHVYSHQLYYLDKVRKGMYYKIPDAGLSIKPFDIVWMTGFIPYIVPIFYKQRQPKKAYLVPLDEFIKMRDNSKKKSFTEKEVSSFQSIII